MSALHEQGSDPQPTRAFLHCGDGRLLPHCCEPFSQTTAQFQPLEGPCEFSSLKQADFFATFPSFITVRVRPEHFPHSLGRNLHPSPSQTLPCMSLPSAHPWGPRLFLWLLMIEFEDGKYPERGIGIHKGRNVLSLWGKQVKTWLGLNTRHCWQLPSMAKYDYKTLCHYRW